jgi:signal transduction histidine kinase
VLFLFCKSEFYHLPKRPFCSLKLVPVFCLIKKGDLAVSAKKTRQTPRWHSAQALLPARAFFIIQGKGGKGKGEILGYILRLLNKILMRYPNRQQGFTRKTLFSEGEGRTQKSLNSSSKQLLLEKIETEQAFRWLLFLRLAFLLLALLTNPLRVSIPAQLIQIFEAIGVPLAIYNIILLLFHRRVSGLLRNFPIIQYIDLAFSCAVLCVGCGWRSSYFGYTVTSIILGTLFDRTRGAWVSSSLMTAVALFVNPNSGYSVVSFDIPTWDMRLGGAIFYVGAGAFCGYFSKVIERLHELKQEKLEEIEKSAIMAHKIAIAHDLHDGVRAKMTAILLIAKGLVGKHRQFDMEVQSELLKLWRWLNYTQTELSNFVDSLQTPSTLEQARTFDIVSLLQQEAKIIEDMTGFTWNMQALPVEIFYSVDHKHNLLSFCSEAMTNAWKHSGVNNGTVHISEKEDTIEIEIADKGKGFDQHIQKNGKSLGMKSLAKRANELQANFTILSEPGKGCSIKLFLVREVLQKPIPTPNQLAASSKK